MSHLMADINFSESKRDTFQTPGIKELTYCSYFVKKNDLSLHKACCSLKQHLLKDFNPPFALSFISNPPLIDFQKKFHPIPAYSNPTPIPYY